MPKMIRLSDTANDQLDKMSAETDEPKQQLLDKAVELLARRYFLEKTNRQYAALKKDPQAWKEELEERELWDATLLDGLQGDDSHDK